MPARGRIHSLRRRIGAFRLAGAAFRCPVLHHLNGAELERLGTVLDGHRDKHPWPVTALRLLTLTGARLSEVLNLRWDEIATLSSEDGGATCVPDTKTGPRTVWIGPEAAKLVAALPKLVFDSMTGGVRSKTWQNHGLMSPSIRCCSEM